MTILLTGGGTAGHIMPHIALLPGLKKHFDAIHYIGSNGIEKKIMATYPEVVFHEIDAPKLRRSISPKNLFIPFKFIAAVKSSVEILKAVKPGIIFSKGGFVSLPVMRAAYKLKIPAILHESDSTMGLANKLSQKYACKILTSFAEAAKSKKAVRTGTPIRAELYSGDRRRGLVQTGLSGVKPVVLVMGGSLGARAINTALRGGIDKLLREFDIIHICGVGNMLDGEKKGYFQTEFALNPADLYATADIVVSRAGSNSINEFAALRKPMLLIPLPKAASRGDQIINARIFQNSGYAAVLPQEKLSPSSLSAAVKGIYAERNRYRAALSYAPDFDGRKVVLRAILECAADNLEN